MIIGWSGLISKILLPLINSKLDVSPSVCAFMSLLVWGNIYIRKQVVILTILHGTVILPFHVGGPTKLARYKDTGG